MNHGATHCNEEARYFKEENGLLLLSKVDVNLLLCTYNAEKQEEPFNKAQLEAKLASHLETVLEPAQLTYLLRTDSGAKFQLKLSVPLET